jgi:hypothetical protein
MSAQLNETLVALGLSQYENKVCQPALVYFVIATVLAICAFLLALLQGGGSMEGNFSQLSSHILWIVCCTLLLTGICNVIGINWSWALVALFILCNLSAASALLSKSFTTYNPMTIIVPPKKVSV